MLARKLAQHLGQAVTIPSHSNRKAWVGLAVLTLPTLVRFTMDMSVLYVAMPVLSADLQQGGMELLWIADIYGNQCLAAR